MDNYPYLQANRCCHCNTIFYGALCPICGGYPDPGGPNIKAPDDKYIRNILFPSGRCQWCGGELVDISVSCKRIVCKECGKEDKHADSIQTTFL